MDEHRESKLGGGRSATRRKKDPAHPVRRRVTRRSTPKQDANEKVASPIRRAPTKTPTVGSNAGLRNRLPSLPHTILGIVVVGLFVASAVIGFTDEGEINIQNVVAERERDLAERRARGEDVLEESSATQSSTDRPRLRPAAARSEPVVSEESDVVSATSTATSTATSSVTDVAGNATPTVATSTDPREEVDDTQEELDDMSPEFSEELEEEESDQASDEPQE